jgi:CheY-like chemotaxis protein
MFSPKVLVVDDHPDGAEALGNLLQALGCDVKVAFSGEDALAMAPEFRPRLVILDIDMGGVNGLETARRMRKQDWAQASVFASHSGSVHPKIADISRKAGFHYHVAKPAQLDTFRHLLDALEDPPESSA